VDLINLQLSKVIIHEVLKRAESSTTQVAPIYSDLLENLDDDGIDALRNRIVAAAASNSRCLNMAITQSGPESMVAYSGQLLDSDDELFIQHSKTVAKHLSRAQQSRSIPGGIVVVVSGTAGVPAKRLIVVIKAEVHSGFTKEQQANGTLILKYLKSLLLTEKTKLYKMGLFIENLVTPQTQYPENWDAYVYDDGLTASNKYDAAKYFYEGFLGCGFLQTSARQTREFHEHTKSFIQSMSVPEESKVDLHNALVTYLKADQSPTISVAAFGTAYFADGAVRDSYDSFMQSKGFPDGAVNKDLTDVVQNLQLRRLVFRNKIRVTGPADQFNKLVTIEPMDGEPAAVGQNAPQWTHIIIKDRLESQT
jgi:hypothetical protein